MTEKIFELAKALGHTESEDETALRELCALAEEELRGRLKEGVDESDCEAAFRVGAAWLALSGICVSSERVERFSAGALTIQQGGGKSAPERSAELRRQCERVMAPYLRDDGFTFLGVRG